MDRFRLGQIEPGKWPLPHFADIPHEFLGSMHIMGSSGEGKSELEIRVAEYAADCGDALLIIDPHGDMAKRFIATTRHQDRVIYCNPTMQTAVRWVFNPLEFDPSFRGTPEFPTYADHVAGSVSSLFAHLGRSDPSFTLVINYLKGAVALALAEKRPTLAHVALVLYSDSYREYLTTNPANKNFWSKFFWFDFERWTDQAERVQLNSSKFRLIDLLQSTYLYNLIGHYRSNVRLGEWLNDGKIVVWDLSGLTEDVAEVFGGLLVSRVITEYRLRAAELVAPGKHAWRIIVDEFHNFAPAPFEILVTAARKYAVFPVMAHQTMGQLWRHADKGKGEPALVSAVNGARVKIRFFTDEQQEEDRELEVHQASLYYRGIPEKRRVTVQLSPYERTLARYEIQEAVRAWAEESAKLATPLRRSDGKSDLPRLEEQFGSWMELDRARLKAPTTRGTSNGNQGKQPKQPKQAKETQSATQGVLPAGNLSAEEDSAMGGGAAGPGPDAGPHSLAGGSPALPQPIISATGAPQPGRGKQGRK